MYEVIVIFGLCSVAMAIIVKLGRPAGRASRQLMSDRSR
jgi:hypothetical protein